MSRIGGEVERLEGRLPEAGWVEVLFRARYTEMVGLAVLLLGNRSRAEDVVQDVFAALQRRTVPLDDPDKASGYLARAVINGCRSQHRRHRTEERHPPGPPTVDRSAEERAISADDVRAVRAALLLLPSRQRACLVCAHHLSMSQSQIADALGLSLGTVKTHLRRGSARLATLLEDQR